MKKIIFAALAVLMMLGFAGCSGDLHDYVDPSLSTWFYVDVDPGCDKVILNTKVGDAGDQTSDMTMDISTGSVYYTYNGGTSCTEFTGADKPASQAGRVWVLSKLNTFNIYCWSDTILNPNWPGVAATKSEIVVED